MNIVTDKEPNDWMTTFEDNLLRIKEPDISFSVYRTPPYLVLKGEIAYYLHSFLFTTDRLQENLIKIVHMNHPKKHWIDCYKNADHLVFQCKRYYDKWELKNKSLISGIDLDKFRPKIRIGICAVRQERKGIDLLGDIIKGTSNNFIFYICGPRWEKDFNDNPKVIKLGYLPDEKTPEFYQSIDYLLITSNIEGGPFPLLEAKACGKQVITTNVGYVGEIPCIVYKDLGEALGIFKDIENENRKDVMDYSWENFRDKHVSLFRRLVNENITSARLPQ